MIEYMVIEVNTLLGFVKLKITYPAPDLVTEDLVVDIDSISSSEDDTEAQLINALNQIVMARYHVVYPGPKRYTPSLQNLKAKKFRV